MTAEEEYFFNKRPDRVYISGPFSRAWTVADDDTGSGALSPPGTELKLRIISKVFDTHELHEFVKVKGELILRVTKGERQEVKAVFYEDSREVHTLTFQRFERRDDEPNTPHKKTNFTFQGQEIERLRAILDLVKYVELPNDRKHTVSSQVLDSLPFDKNSKERFLEDNVELVAEFARNKLTRSDIIALGYRKEQLKLFEELLKSDGRFEQKQRKWGKRRKEDVWQHFFENNPWIFGYGLNYVFTSRLDDKKLEQVTSGYSVAGSGKRVDALMKTLGYISSLCFVEIKTHQTPLLDHREPYRVECWRISDELAGSVAQVQKTVHKAVKDIQERIEFKGGDGAPTGESTYLYQPKAYVVVGCLEEFNEEYGVNEEKFSSFELFRRNVVSPEIITYDELFERAKFIVQHSESEEPLASAASPEEEDDIPF